MHIQEKHIDPFGEKQPETPKKLIAIIDDSATVCKIIETCLKREGYAVQSFPDGIEAMRAFIQPGVRLPDLIMLDINLPKMDGYAIAHHLKAKPAFSQRQIVMISRRYGPFDRLRSRLAGASVHLSKPIKTDEIIATVMSLIGPP